MATLVLGIAGSAIGGALLPGGLSLLGTALTGKVVGSTIGTTAGALVDQALLGPLTGATGQTSMPQGPRVSDLKLGTSSEGTPLPRVYGRARLPGQLIWATRFKEKKEKVKQQTAGGKNATSTTGSGKDAKTIKYTYFANVAYALCEGPITRIGTIWADGKKLKKNKFDFDIHYGTETQTPDDFIENKEGDEVPAYRGTAYVVAPLSTAGQPSCPDRRRFRPCHAWGEARADKNRRQQGGPDGLRDRRPRAPPLTKHSLLPDRHLRRRREC